MNYGLDYAGAPYSGIAMMILFCMTIGIYMSFVTLKTNNCMYAAIIHGAVNIIGETPIFISLSTQSVLLGPNPSGVIGGEICTKKSIYQRKQCLCGIILYGLLPPQASRPELHGQAVYPRAGLSA